MLDVRKELDHLSISQVEKYHECPRRHYHEYVLGEKSDSTASQEYGKKCHEILEQYLRGEICLEDVLSMRFYGKTLSEGIKFLPTVEMGLSGKIEDYFEISLEGLPVNVIGYIDYYHVSGSVARLIDHKIVKTDRYLLSEEELRRKYQIVVYSKFLLDKYDVSMVEASYFYYLRGGGFKEVRVDLTRDYIEQQLKLFIKVAQDTAQNYSKELDATTQQLSSCEKWGGCPFKSQCWGVKNQMSNNSLFDRLKAISQPTDSQPEVSSTPQVQLNNAQRLEPSIQFIPSSGRGSLFDAIAKRSEAVEKNNDIFSIDKDDEGDNTNGDDSDESEDLFTQIAATEEQEISVLMSADQWARDADDLFLDSIESLPQLVGEDDINIQNQVDSAEDTTNETSDLIEYADDSSSLTSITIDQSSKETLVVQPDTVSQDISILDLRNRTKNALTRAGFTTFQSILNFFTEKGIDIAQLQPSTTDTEDGVFTAVQRVFSDTQGIGYMALIDISRLLKKEFFKIEISEQEESSSPPSVVAPVAEVVAEPVAEVVAEVVAESVAEVVAEVVAEPVAEVVAEPVAEVVAEPVAEVVAEVVAEPVAEVIAEPAPTQPLVQIRSLPTKTLFLSCLPVKSDTMFNSAEDLLGEIERGVAHSNQVAHISLLGFGKGYDQLAAVVSTKDWLGDRPIYVSAIAQNVYAKAITELTKKADLVIRGTY